MSLLYDVFPPEETGEIFTNFVQNRCDSINVKDRNQSDFVQGTAPHLLKLVDSAFFATDFSCLVDGSIIQDDARKAAGHQAAIPGHAEMNHQIPVIKEFLNQLEPAFVYDLNIYDAFGFDRKFSLVSVLTAAWKIVEKFEESRGTEAQIFDKVLKAMENAFDEHNLDKTELIASLNAAMDASGDYLYFIYHEKYMEEGHKENIEKRASNEHLEDRSKIDISWLRLKYDLVFMTSHNHYDPDLLRESIGSVEFGNELRLKLTYESENPAYFQHSYHRFIKFVFDNYYVKKSSYKMCDKCVHAVDFAAMKEKEKLVVHNDLFGSLFFMKKEFSEHKIETLKRMAQNFNKNLKQDFSVTVVFYMLKKGLISGIVSNQLANEHEKQEMLVCVLPPEIKREKRKREDDETSDSDSDSDDRNSSSDEESALTSE